MRGFSHDPRPLLTLTSFGNKPPRIGGRSSLVAVGNKSGFIGGIDERPSPHLNRSSATAPTDGLRRILGKVALPVRSGPVTQARQLVNPNPAAPLRDDGWICQRADRLPAGQEERRNEAHRH